MKTFGLVCSAVLFLIAVGLIGCVYFIENHYQRADKGLIPFGDIVIQHHQKTADLYAADGSGPIGTWQEKTPEIYAYQGKTGVYSYFLRGAQTFQVRVPVEKAWQYGNVVLSLTVLFYSALFAIVVATIFLLMALTQRSSVPRRAKPSASLKTSLPPVDRIPEITLQSLESKEPASTNNDELLAAKENALKYQQEAERERKKREQSERESERYRAIAEEKTQQIEAIHVDKKREIREIKAELKKAAKDEAYTRYKVEVGQMKAAHDALQSKYDLAVARAKVLDINLEDENIENILKGRRFEIYIANLFVNNGFEILEWTPDKGIENNLFVRQNNNPDLLLRKRSSDSCLAVECKFVSQAFQRHGCGQPVISWCEKRKYKHYNAYAQEDRSRPVYVVVGFQGTASNPKQCFWGRLHQLKDMSLTLEPAINNVKKSQYVIKESDIGPLIFSEREIQALT